ncbi:MAG: hypothetical protein ACLGIR_11100 [Actinomycetes bacterium]
MPSQTSLQDRPIPLASPVPAPGTSTRPSRLRALLPARPSAHGSTPVPAVVLLRLLAAGATIGGGVLHLQLWQGGFRGLPLIGPMFLANAVAAAAVGLAVGWRPGRVTVLLALGISVGSLVGLVLSHTVGLFGFRQGGWDPAQARVVATELLAAAALLGLAAARRTPAHEAPASAA